MRTAKSTIILGAEQRLVLLIEALEQQVTGIANLMVTLWMPMSENENLVEAGIDLMERTPVAEP